jgi:ABC-type dipeptide/oligopeptide/nickel transport system ATPase subunit
MNTYQTKEKLMAEQTDAHDFVQSRNKAMQFDREKKQKQIKSSFELHKDTQEKITDMSKKLIASHKTTEEIDKELVLKSIQTAQMNDWLNGTKNGLETLIGENGKMISGGERQRIGIARTLYFDTEFIVLDEPTSSLDEETTNKFLDVLQSLKNKTIII